MEVILSHCSIGNELFFPLVTEQLAILERYLSTATSRVIIFEAVERILAQLLALKCLFIRLYETEGREAHRSASHRNSPRRATNDRSIGRSSIATREGTIGLRLPQSERTRKPPTPLDLAKVKKQGQASKQREAFVLFLKVVSELQLKGRSPGVVHTLPELFSLDPQFEIVTAYFVRSVFEEVMDLGLASRQILEESGLLSEDASEFSSNWTKKVIVYGPTQQKLFQQAKLLVESYHNQLVFCKLLIVEYKLNDRGDTKGGELKRQLKKKLPSLLNRSIQFFESPDGILWQFLSSQNDTMSKLAKNGRFQTIKSVPGLSYNLNLLFNLFHGVFDLLATGFGVKSKYSDFLGEAMVSVYVRLCYFSFVKIYSYISNSEIIQLNNKIVKKLNEEKSKGKDDIFAGGDKLSKRKHSFPILLSKVHLRLVLSIALNRTELTKNIFYQFRIMEFFYKEIDLEFEVSQKKARFLEIRNNVKDNLSRGTSPKRDFMDDKSPSVQARQPEKTMGLVGLKLDLGKLPPKQENNEGTHVSAGNSFALNFNKLVLKEKGVPLDTIKQQASESKRSQSGINSPLPSQLSQLQRPPVVKIPGFQLALPKPSNVSLEKPKLQPYTENFEPVEDDEDSSVDISYPLEETPQKLSKRDIKPQVPVSFKLSLKKPIDLPNVPTQELVDDDRSNQSSSSTFGSAEMRLMEQAEVQVAENKAAQGRPGLPLGFKLQLPASNSNQPQAPGFGITLPPKLNLGLNLPQRHSQPGKSSPRNFEQSQPPPPPKKSDPPMLKSRSY